jgi:hypothetical protein
MSAPGAPSTDSGRLRGALLAGALLATLAEVALLMLAMPARRFPATAPPALAFVRFVFDGGWLAFPLVGAGIAATLAARWRTGPARARALALGVVLLLLPLVARPAITALDGTRAPRSTREKFTAIRRWSYHTPRTAARILDLAHDPRGEVREEVALALGRNLLVDDVERANPVRPARWPQHPVRTAMRAQLQAMLAGDSLVSVRAEAARALWNAPRAYGPQPAAAETLAAVLDRAARPGALERLTWLALDAAAGPPDSGLRAAAARFAAATPDTQLQRVARLAAGPH